MAYNFNFFKKRVSYTNHEHADKSQLNVIVTQPFFILDKNIQKRCLYLNCNINMIQSTFNFNKRKYINVNQLICGCFNKIIRGYSNKILNLEMFTPNTYNEISLKEYHKFTIVKFKIITGIPLMSQSNINAIIGPYGVNIMNLQKKLEPLNSLFISHVKISIFLKVYGFDRYQIFVKGPSLSYFLKQIKENSNFFSIYQIFELTKKKKLEPGFSNLEKRSIYFSIIGFLKSDRKNIFYNKLKDYER